MHVEYLARELAAARRPHRALLGRRARAGRRAAPRSGRTGRGTPSPAAARTAAALQAVSIDLAMAARRRGRGPRAQPHLVRQPRRPSGQAAVRRSRTSRRCTAWSRCGRGRRSSSAAAMRVSSFCERTALEAADAIIAVSREQARDVLACYPAIDPARVSVIHNGIDTEEYRPDPGTDVLRAPRHRPGRARRSSSSAASRARRASPTRSTPRCDFDPGRAARALRRRAGHAGDRGRDRAPRSTRVRAERGNVVWIDEMLPQRRGRPAPQPRDRVRLPVDLRAARHRQPRGDGLRDGRRRDRAPAASPRSSRTASRACSCRSSRATTARATRVDPERFARDIAERVNELLADPARAERMGKAGRHARSSTSPGPRSRPRRSRSTSRCSGTRTAQPGSDPQRAGLTPPVRSEEECMAWRPGFEAYLTRD